MKSIYHITSNLIFKYNTLKEIRDALIEFNNCDNYYVQDNRNYTNIETYYKDGVMKTLFNDSQLFVWSDGKDTYFKNSNTENTLIKQNYTLKRLSFNILDCQNLENNRILELTFDPLIKVSKELLYNPEEDTKTEYIRIKNNNKEIVYFDINTKLPILYIDAYFITHYKITLNSTNNDDIALNLDDYNVISN